MGYLARTIAWCRGLIPSTLATRAFLAVTTVEALCNITLEGLILRKGEFFNGLFRSRQDHQDGATLDNQQVLPVYLAIFAMAHAFQFVLAVDAIYNRNTIQIIGLVLFNLLFLAYAIMSISEVRSAFEEIGKFTSDVETYVTIVPCMIAVAQMFFFVLSWFIWREFGWDVFKHLGADRRIKKMYLAYQVFICVCKFDVFFVFAFTVQFVVLVLSQQDVERYLTIAAAPVTIGILAAGFIAARREIKWMMGIFFTGCVLGSGYFIFKLFRTIQNTNNQYTSVQKSLITFSVISLIALLGTIGQASVVFRNFGKGLKFHMNLKHLATPRHKAPISTPDLDVESTAYDEFSDVGNYKLESKSSRMSID